MKRLSFFLLLAVLFGGVSLWAQSAPTPKATVIDIQKRPKPKMLLREEKVPAVGENFEFWAQADIPLLEQTNGGLYAIRAYSATDSLYVYNEHPFIYSIRAAYADHRPLVLSPDIVWLVITNGFGQHVKNNAEALRSKLVGFDGKVDLVVTCEPGLIDMPAQEWEPYFGQFTDSIAKHAGRELTNTLVSNFSTTTPTALVASQVSAMAAMKSYFNYVMVEGCGIPTVTLEGTPEDWQKLVEKAHALRQYDLDWWMDELEPVLQKMARAAAGEVDRDFWKAIYKNYELDREVGCGIVATEKINGWVLKFYPYDYSGNRTDFKEMTDDAIAYLPQEVSYAPLKYVEFPSGRKRSLMLFAGLQGMEQDHQSFAVRPRIVWYVAERVEE